MPPEYLNSCVCQSFVCHTSVLNMDLSSPKVTNEEKLDLCRKYFYFGFAFLPFLWCVNAIWFFKEAFYKPPYAEQAKIKRFVIFSGIGSLTWLVALIAWMSVFISKRAEWGELGDRLSFNIPTGTP